MLATLVVLLCWFRAAQAEAPPVLPTAEPADVFHAYAEFALSKGRTGAATELACRPLSEGLSLCFSYVEDGVSRLVTRAELAQWAVTLPELEARATALSAPAPGRYAPQQVEGMSGTFWLSTDGSGLSAGGWLHPASLASLAGGTPVVAAPDNRSLLFWIPGDEAFDKVLAVGVRRMYDAADHPVSPLIYRWDGEAWAVWGQAREQSASPGIERPARP